MVEWKKHPFRGKLGGWEVSGVFCVGQPLGYKEGEVNIEFYGERMSFSTRV